MKSVLLLMLFMLVALFIGCAKPYTYYDKGKTIELGEDDSFQIVLEGNNKTDCNWIVASLPQFIILETSDKINYKGRVIDYVFSFKTISYGSGVIELIYTDGYDVINTYQLTVLAGVMGIITSE